MARACDACNKILKSTSGFERHRQKCKERPRRLPHPDQIRFLSLQQQPQLVSAYKSQNPIVTPQDHTHYGIDHPSSHPNDNTSIDEGEIHTMIYDNTVFERESLISEANPSFNRSLPETENLKVHDDDWTNGQDSQSSRHGLLSTFSRSMIVVTFQEITAIAAGAAVENDDIEMGESVEEDPITYPFQSKFDYFFGTWLRSSGISKGNVDRLLKDPRAAILVQHLSFDSGSEWH
jgi:hypothetical protein